MNNFLSRVSVDVLPEKSQRDEDCGQKAGLVSSDYKNKVRREAVMLTSGRLIIN